MGDLNASKSKIMWGSLSILALFIVALIFDFPAFFNGYSEKLKNKIGVEMPKIQGLPFKLGLDLMGGARLTYRTEMEKISFGEREGSVEGLRDVIERRVNALGVSESLVQTNKSPDEYRIIVELPGITDINQAIKIIGETPILEFREENNAKETDLTPEQRIEMEKYNTDALKRTKNLIANLKSGAQFEELAKKFSEDLFTKDGGGKISGITRKHEFIEFYDWAKNAGINEYTNEPIKTKDGFNIIKVLLKEPAEPTFNANHLLICFKGALKCEKDKTKDEALAAINEIKSKISPENFADMAKQYSDDASATNGGNLGEIGRGFAVKPFEDALFALEEGKISDVVETDFGFHLIYSTGKNKHFNVDIQRILIKTKTAEDFLPFKGDWRPTGLTGSDVKRATVQFDQYTGEPQVELEYNDAGKNLLAEVTGRNLNKPLAIFLDGTPINIPIVQSEITNGRALISGQFTPEDAKLLAQRLNAGALPIPVKLIAQETIGATLGADSLQKSLKAGMLGLLLILVFMLALYRAPGVVAMFSLLLYGLIVLAIFKLIPVTLTLAGIAGFILSIGMAVDANILIFERMKEEIRRGRSWSIASEEGFKRAWTSIRDANLSTIISCIILYWIGIGVVRGFAVTLIIGILISMFTAITVTRTLLKLFNSAFFEKHKWLFFSLKSQGQNNQNN